MGRGSGGGGRGGGKSGGGGASASPKPAGPASDSAVLAELRSIHGDRTQTPVHELRARVAAKFGAAAASPAHFDAQILRLADRDRISLYAISDLRKATKEQLRQAIPGVNETLFYVKPKGH